MPSVLQVIIGTLISTMINTFVRFTIRGERLSCNGIFYIYCTVSTVQSLNRFFLQIISDDIAKAKCYHVHFGFKQGVFESMCN